MSTSKDQPRWFGGLSEPYSPRDWSLRTKLLVVLLVPAVLAAILGGLRIADQAGEAAEQNRVSRFVDVQAEVATLVERLQTERLLATSYVAGDRRGDIAPLDLAIADVDRTREQTGPSVENLSADDPALVGASRQSQQALARLPSLRNLVTTSNAPASAVVSRYSELVAQIVQLDNALLRGVNTPEVAGLATGLAGLAVARNEASLQQAQLAVVAQTGQLSDPEIAELQSSNARLRTGLVDFRAALDAGQRVRYAGVIAGATNTERDLLVQGVVAGTAGAQASGLYDTFLGELDAAEDGVRTELRETSEATRLTAVSLALINAFLLLLALVIGVAVVGLIARQMIGSLRTLRRGAMDVAERRLPDAVQRMRQGSVPDVNVEPVPVQTREEVGEVARAFDAVHTQAVRLAAEQATLQNNVNAMFVNLSRRSQTLVDRQLKLIEELEAGEEDPDQLSHLFRLDHLATRMRRNSENLLVLAGTELAQRAVRPVPVVEVLQAAVSEVEQYRRIVVSPPPDLAVVGRVGNDLQHLLAELLDNATNFSPPDSRVVMSTSRTDDGTFVVEIVDDGVGLPAAELAQINEQLGLPSDATVEASRRMGLFVVGRLAARHGIEVTLSSGSTAPRPEGVARSTAKPNQGLTALVRVPRLLIHDGFGPARRSGAQRSPATAPRRDTESTAGQANGAQRTAPPPQPQSSRASAPPAPAAPPQPAPPRATQPESRPPSAPRPPAPQPTRPQPPSPPPAARPSAQPESRPAPAQPESRPAPAQPESRPAPAPQAESRPAPAQAESRPAPAQPESRPAPASPVPAGRTPPVGPARTPRSTSPSPGPDEGDGQERRRPTRAEDAPARAENRRSRRGRAGSRREHAGSRRGHAGSGRGECAGAGRRAHCRGPDPGHRSDRRLGTEAGGRPRRPGAGPAG